ncbi:MAG: hypothetical protein LQ341_006668, partial [Variospora aurantia]
TNIKADDFPIDFTGALQVDFPLRQAAETLAPGNGSSVAAEREPIDTSRFTEKSASSEYIPSSSEEETVSESSSDEDRRYYDGQKWRYEDCEETLADCDCGNKHADYICGTCGSEAADIELCTRCPKCHQSFEGPFSECRVLEDSKSDGDMEDQSERCWDNLEQAWRCVLCFWEVEANNADEGHCHCVSAQGSDLLRHIELADYLDYKQHCAVCR